MQRAMRGSRAQGIPALPFLLSVHAHHTLPSSWRVYWGVTCSAGFNVVIPLPPPILSIPVSGVPQLIQWQPRQHVESGRTLCY